MDIKFRIQEWAADHFKGIQYPAPRARLIKSPKPRPTPIPMNFGTWLILLIVGSGAVVGGVLVVGFMLYFVVPAFFA